MNEGGATEKPARFVRGSGNVFDDVGLPHPAEALVKAQLAEVIHDAIQHRGLTQVEAAGMLGIDQPAISKVSNGRLDGFSQERLMRYLTELGVDVEIVIHRRGTDHTKGRLTVSVDPGPLPK